MLDASYRNQTTCWPMIMVNCIVEWLNYESALSLNPFQPSVAFHIETSYFFCSAKQLASFFMKCNTGLQWVNVNWGYCRRFSSLPITNFMRTRFQNAWNLSSDCWIKWCNKTFKKLYGPFLWIVFNCLVAVEPIRRYSLLLTTKFPRVPGTHLIDS